MLCVCVIGCSNGPSSAGRQAGRHMAEALPSTASRSWLYRSPGGRDPPITLPKPGWERSELTGLESTNVLYLLCVPSAALFREMCGPIRKSGVETDGGGDS